MIYTISDTHFHHFNIIRLCERPFHYTQEMNEHMIKEWNDIVKPDDVVIHLGDFLLGNKQKLEETCNRLNGKKILVRGNHDRSHKQMIEGGFYKSYNYLWLRNKTVLLIHNPYDIQNFKTMPKIIVHGHIHNKTIEQCDYWEGFKSKGYGRAKYINVGAEKSNYKPKLLKELINE